MLHTYRLPGHDILETLMANIWLGTGWGSWQDKISHLDDREKHRYLQKRIACDFKEQKNEGNLDSFDQMSRPVRLFGHGYSSPVSDSRTA